MVNVPKPQPYSGISGSRFKASTTARDRKAFLLPDGEDFRHNHAADELLRIFFRAPLPNQALVCFSRFRRVIVRELVFDGFEDGGLQMGLKFLGMVDSPLCLESKDESAQPATIYCPFVVILRNDVPSGVYVRMLHPMNGMDAV
jgi:hypothetical protein